MFILFNLFLNRSFYHLIRLTSQTFFRQQEPPPPLSLLIFPTWHPPSLHLKNSIVQREGLRVDSNIKEKKFQISQISAEIGFKEDISFRTLTEGHLFSTIVIILFILYLVSVLSCLVLFILYLSGPVWYSLSVSV